jgi:Putative Actinobacterial Holin-X, holin superfamily III
MATDVHPETEPSLTALVAGILKDVQDLVKQQVAMVRQEIKADFHRTVQAASAIAAGIAIGVLGGLLLCSMLVYLLAWTFPAVPLWGCYAIVGGSLTAVGTTLFYLGKKKLSSFNPLPDQSVEAIKENIRWIKNPT